jgi:eukaryotic-like serine/threonine-protein kinase
MSGEKTEIDLRGFVRPGTELNGIYAIDAPIATGGMGEVYKGHAIQTGDPVAIKIIKQELVSNEAAMALFRKEASALHQLQHESIVRYYVSSIEPTLKRPYLAMEYVSGLPLSDFLTRRKLDFAQAMTLKSRLAAGLQAAHDKGIIHRDISPDNILLPGGEVASAKIIDFGIARATKSSEATVIGDGFAGKYSWVSPEQLGLYNGEVTARSDIYSLGLVLAASMRGKPLDMGGSQFEVIEKRRSIPDLTGLDKRIQLLVEWMLEPDPADRPASMAEVAAWTPDAKSLDPVPAPSSVGGGLSAKAIGIGAAFLMIAGGGAFIALRPAPPTAPTPPSPLAVATAPAPVAPAAVAIAAVPPEIGSLPPPAAFQPGAIAPVPAVPDLTPLAADRPIRPVSSGEQVTAIQRYIRTFDAGGCTLLLPGAVTASTAGVEGVAGAGADLGPFRDDFRRINGFDAEMNLQTPAPGQCEAIDILRLMDFDKDPRIRLELPMTGLRAGQTARGGIDGVGDRQLHLLTVLPNGTIVSNDAAISRERGSWRIAYRLEQEDADARRPRLALFLASQRRLDSLKDLARPTPPEDVFSALLDELQRSPQAVALAVKIIKVE